MLDLLMASLPRPALALPSLQGAWSHQTLLAQRGTVVTPQPCPLSPGLRFSWGWACSHVWSRRCALNNSVKVLPSKAAGASFLLPWFIAPLNHGEGDGAFLCAQGDSFNFMIQRREKSHTLIYCIPLCSSQRRSNSLKSLGVHVFAPVF